MSALGTLVAQKPLCDEREDRRLAQMAAGGSELAFEAIVARYRVRLVAYARRMVGPTHAEDIVQQALTNAWDALHRGCDVVAPRAWLFAIVHRSALELLRSDTGYFGELPDTLAGGHSPHEYLELRGRTRRMLSAIASLPENEREALISTSVHGHSAREAAHTLGVSEDAVRQLVFRARSRVRAAAPASVPAFSPPGLLGWLRVRASASISHLQRAHPPALTPSPGVGGVVVALALAAGAATPLLAGHSTPASPAPRGSVASQLLVGSPASASRPAPRAGHPSPPASLRRPPAPAASGRHGDRRPSVRQAPAAAPMPSAPAGARDASPHGAATPVLRTNARRGPSAGRLGTRLRGAVSSVRSAGAAPLLEVADRTAGEALAATAGFALAGARQAAEAPAQLPLAGAEAAGGLAKVPAG